MLSGATTTVMNHLLAFTCSDCSKLLSAGTHILQQDASKQIIVLRTSHQRVIAEMTRSINEAQSKINQQSDTIDDLKRKIDVLESLASNENNRMHTNDGEASVNPQLSTLLNTVMEAIRFNNTEMNKKIGIIFIFK